MRLLLNHCSLAPRSEFKTQFGFWENKAETNKNEPDVYEHKIKDSITIYAKKLKLQANTISVFIMPALILRRFLWKKVIMAGIRGIGVTFGLA